MREDAGKDVDVDEEEAGKGKAEESRCLWLSTCG